jgi:hypothetical protein
MREVSKQGMAMALVLGLAVSLAAAQGRDDGPRPMASGSGRWSEWLSGKDKPEAKKEAVEKPSAGPSVLERAEAVRQRELKNYLRRIDVCDKLAQIAEDTNDPQLLNEIEEIKERVWAVYQQRTANLIPGASSELADVPVPGDPLSRKPVLGRSRNEGPRTAAAQEAKP